MKYKSICTVCGRQTPISDGIVEHSYMKAECGFISVDLVWSTRWGGRSSLNFCPSCAKKSYTIEELVNLRVCSKEWSY